MRPLRYVPPGGALVEVTCRTLHGRFLLLPSEELKKRVIGILARAQRLYPAKICAFAFLSNHYHLLLEVEDTKQLARFVGYLNSNLAREAGRLVKWRERFWSQRYEAILVTDEARSQIARLRYVLSQGCKEGLVPRPQDWPGAHSARALLGLEPLQGVWIDRTRACRRSAEHVADYTYPEHLHLAPIPAWRDLSPAVYRQRVAALIQQIIASCAADLRSRGIEPLGPEDLQKLKPHDSAALPARRPAPFCHAATRIARRALLDAYRQFVSAFRAAAIKLRRRHLESTFPEGSFPPALPFVAR